MNLKSLTIQEVKGVYHQYQINANKIKTLSSTKQSTIKTKLQEKQRHVIKVYQQLLQVAKIVKLHLDIATEYTQLSIHNNYLKHHNLKQNQNYVTRHPTFAKKLGIDTRATIVNHFNNRQHITVNKCKQAIKDNHKIQAKKLYQKVIKIQKYQQSAQQLPMDILMFKRMPMQNNYELQQISNGRLQKLFFTRLHLQKYYQQAKQILKQCEYLAPAYSQSNYQYDKNVSLPFWKAIDKYVDKKTPLVINNDTQNKIKEQHGNFTGRLMYIYKELVKDTHSIKLAEQDINKYLLNNDIAKNCLCNCFELSPYLVDKLIKQGLIRGINKTKKHPAYLEFIHRQIQPQNTSVNDNAEIDTVRHDVLLNAHKAKFGLGKQNAQVTGVTYLAIKEIKNGVCLPDINKKFWDDKHNLNHYGFHFKTGTGHHQLVVTASPISALSFLQLHKHNAFSIRNTTFLVLNDPYYQINYLHQFIQHYHFKRVILAHDNSKQGYQLTQRIASQYGERLAYVHNNHFKPRIIVYVPTSSSLHHSADYRWQGDYNKTWNQELRTQHRMHHAMERPSFQLNLDDYGLLTTNQLMLHLHKDQAQIFDVIAQALGKIDQYDENITKRNPHIKLINHMAKKLNLTSKRYIQNYFNYSGKYLPAVDIARYTQRADKEFYEIGQYKNQINHYLQSTPVQNLLNQRYNTKQQTAQQLYFTALVALVNIQQQSTSPHQTLNKIYITRHKMNQILQKGCLDKLQKHFPQQYQQYLQQTPDLKKKQSHYTAQEKHNDYHTAQTMVKQNLKLTYLTDALTDDNLKQYQRLTKLARQQTKMWYKEQRHLTKQRKLKNKQTKTQITSLMAKVPRKDMSTFSKIIYNQGLMKHISNPRLQKQYQNEIKQESNQLTNQSKVIMGHIMNKSHSPQYMHHVLQQAELFAKRMQPTGHHRLVTKDIHNGHQSALDRIKLRKKQQDKYNQSEFHFKPTTPKHSKKWKKLHHSQGLSW